MKNLNRRNFLKVSGSSIAAGVAVGSLGLPSIALGASKKVVVVGGGAAGAVAAKYIKIADSSIDVTLVEKNQHYYTCFMSNEVLGGYRDLDTLKFDYNGLAKHGIKVVHGTATKLDPAKKTITLKNGEKLSYDHAVVAPGIDFQWNKIEGYNEATSEKFPHAYKAGHQTALLHKQLVAMPNGGTVIIAPPANPFRCPPGPYERACQIAHYLKTHKPKSKILVIDAKDKFSKQGLFTRAWKDLYAGMIEWMSSSDTGGGIVAVHPKKKVASTELEDFKADVINIIPPQKAGHIAHAGGLTNDAGWCPVDLATFESRLHKGVHVIGDASVATGLPKSAYAANSEAKVCAAAIVAMIHGKKPGIPSYVNTCYSIAAPDYGFSVAAVYKLADDKTKINKLSGGLSPVDASDDIKKREAEYAYSWFQNITVDMFA